MAGGCASAVDYSLFDVPSRREVPWVTSNVDSIFRLIHPYIVHTHVDREGHVRKIDSAKAP